MKTRRFSAKISRLTFAVVLGLSQFLTCASAASSEGLTTPSGLTEAQKEWWSTYFGTDVWLDDAAVLNLYDSEENPFTQRKPILISSDLLSVFSGGIADTFDLVFAEGDHKLEIGFEDNRSDQPIPFVNFSSSSFEIKRDATFTLRTPNEDSLFFLGEGSLTLTSALEGSVITESAGSAVFDLKGGKLTIQEGAKLNLNLYYEPLVQLAESATDAAALRVSNINNQATLSIKGGLGITAAGSGVTAIEMTAGTMEVQEKASVTIYSAATGINLSGSASLLVGGSSLVFMDSKFEGLNLNGKASALLCDNATLIVNSNSVGIDVDSNASMKVSGGRLTVDAEKVFSGAGSVLVEKGSVTLNGSLKDFSGTYSQKDGTLILQGGTQLTQNFELGAVTLTGSSGNIFSSSVAAWKETADSVAQLDTLFTAQSSGVHTIILTDDVVHLSYLLDVASLTGLEKTKFFVSGLEEGGRFVSNVTLEQYEDLKAYIPELVLAQGILQLDGNTAELSKKVEIGAIQLLKDTSGLLSLKSGAEVALYRQGGGEVLLGVEKLHIASGAQLRIGSLDLTRASGGILELSSQTEVKSGGQLHFAGQVRLNEGADIDSMGLLTVESAGTLDAYAPIAVRGTTLTVGEAAQLRTDNTLTLKEAELLSNGRLEAATLLTEASTLSLKGASFGAALNKVNSWQIASGTEARVEGGAQLQVDSLFGEGLTLRITGDKTEYSAVTLSNYNDAQNSQFRVDQGGLLVLGTHGVGFGHEDLLDALDAITTVDGRAVLAVNDTVQLAAGTHVTVGSVLNSKATGRTSSVTLAADSAFVILPELDKPAFSATEAGLVVTKEEGAQIYVIDALKKTWVADESVTFSSPFSESEILSANRHVTLEMRQENGNWFIAKKDIVQNDFVYPELQGALYESGISVDSTNAAERFFARVDNDLYMSESGAAALIGEVTQQSVLLGVRNTALNALRLNKKVRSTVFESHARGTLRPLAVLDAQWSKATRLGGYLGSAGYTAKSSGIALGAEYYPQSDWRLTWSFAADRTATEAKHSVFSAKSKQNTFATEFEALTSFGTWDAGARLGAARFSARINGVLPASMDMGSSFGRHRETLLSAAVFADLRVHPNLTLGVAPAVRHFTGETVETSLGGAAAFSEKIDGTTFAELPLRAVFKHNLKETSGWTLGWEAEAEALIRAGNLHQKAQLSAIGTGAAERTKQKEFSRWVAGTELRAIASKENFEARAEFGVSKGARETAVGGSVRLNWRF